MDKHTELQSLPQRKTNRLRAYDYHLPGYYFITICSHNKEKIFWLDKAGSGLSRMGKIVEQSILGIEMHYPAASIEKYVIMPNHVHLILKVDSDIADGRSSSVSVMIGQMKRNASKQAQCALWQKSFHDHVIRGEQDYQEIWKYIDENPIKWNEDCYFEE